jgi:flagellar protein FliS
MHTTSAISAYSDVGLQTSIMTADPHQLTAMLFEGALLSIARARVELANKDIAAKGQSISKAMAIIGEGLNASLDKKVGGELAQNLSALYDYMVRRLVEANVKNEPAILDEVARLLGELKEAWDSIRPQVVRPEAQPAAVAGARRYAHA